MTKTQKVNGRQVITTGALVYCNTKYHKPYLARITAAGEMEWQDKEYIGYGKHRQTFYVVEDLRVGDLIQCAGGSGGNKYPFKGRVTEITGDSFDAETISEKEWSNILAELKNGEGKQQATRGEAKRLLVAALGLVGHDGVANLLKEMEG